MDAGDVEHHQQVGFMIFLRICDCSLLCRSAGAAAVSVGDSSDKEAYSWYGMLKYILWVWVVGRLRTCVFVDLQASPWQGFGTGNILFHFSFHSL